MTPAKSPSVRAAPARPWQFSLRALLTAVAVCAAVCGGLQSLGGLPAAVLVLCLLLIGSHVLGTRISVLVREAGMAERIAAGETPPAWTAARPTLVASRLRERGVVVRTRIVTTSIVLGAVLGGAGGGTALAATIWDRTPWPGLLLGVVSSAALGGFLGFLASACLHVAAQAVRQASRDTGTMNPAGDNRPTPATDAPVSTR